MNSLKRQRGITLSGLIMGSALLGVVALIGMKLFPLYNEYFKVKGSLSALASQPDVAEQSPADLRKLLLKNFEVQDVDTFTPQNIKNYTKIEKIKGSENRLFTIAYEVRGSLFSELDVVLKVNESIELGAK